MLTLSWRGFSARTCPTVPQGEAEPGAAAHEAGPGGHDRGRAVQADPIKPTSKAPGTKRLKLICDDPLSSFAYKFNLRRYIKAQAVDSGEVADGDGHEQKNGLGGGGTGTTALASLGGGGSGLAQAGTRAFAAGAGGAGGFAAAMAGSMGKSAEKKALITFPDPGPLDGIKNRSQVICRIDDLTFSYATSPSPVLDGVNARVTLGSRVAMVGANGAGKTTLLKNIVGELEPSEGRADRLCSPRHVMPFDFCSESL